MLTFSVNHSLCNQREKRVVKTDEMLVEEIRDGNQKSFDELMQKYQQQVYHIAFSYAKTSAGAMDITQNIFLKIYENLARFRGDSRFKTWLMRISYNESQNWIKKNRKHMVLEDINEQAGYTSSPVNQEDEYLAIENRTLLLKSLYDLNTKYRLAVVLRYFENYSIVEIAEILDCSEGVVKNMLFRSLKKLRSIANLTDFGENK